MNPEPPAVRESGFTLLEMLVTLVVLGLLMVGLVRGVRTALSIWDAQSRRIGETADLDAAARSLRTLLTEIPIKPPNQQGEPGVAARAASAPPLVISGDNARLSIVGDLPSGLGTSRRAEITLELSAKRLVLLWRPHRHEQSNVPPTQEDEVELVAGVDRVELAYWGAVNPGDAPAWLGTWDGPALPRLIRLRLGFAKGDLRHWPDLIAAPRLWAPAG